MYVGVDTSFTFISDSILISGVSGGIPVILKCSDDGKTVTVRSKAEERSKETETIDDKRGDGEDDNYDDEDKEDSVVASDTSGSLHMQHNTITRQVKFH